MDHQSSSLPSINLLLDGIHSVTINFLRYIIFVRAYTTRINRKIEEPRKGIDKVSVRSSSRLFKSFPLDRPTYWGLVPQLDRGKTSTPSGMYTTIVSCISLCFSSVQLEIFFTESMYHFSVGRFQWTGVTVGESGRGVRSRGLGTEVKDEKTFVVTRV